MAANSASKTQGATKSKDHRATKSTDTRTTHVNQHKQAQTTAAIDTAIPATVVNANHAIPATITTTPNTTTATITPIPYTNDTELKQVPSASRATDDLTCETLSEATGKITDKDAGKTLDNNAGKAADKTISKAADENVIPNSKPSSFSSSSPKTKGKLTNKQFQQLCGALQEGKPIAELARILDKPRNIVDWCVQLIDKQGLTRAKRMLVDGQYNVYTSEQLRNIALLKYQKGISAEELEITFGTSRNAIYKRCATLSSYYAAQSSCTVELPDTRISYVQLLRAKLPESLLLEFEQGLLSDFTPAQHNALMFRLYHTNMCPLVKKQLTTLSQKASSLEAQVNLKTFLKHLADTPLKQLVLPANADEYSNSCSVKRVKYTQVYQDDYSMQPVLFSTTYEYPVRPKFNSAEKAEIQAQKAICKALRIKAQAGNILQESKETYSAKFPHLVDLSATNATNLVNSSNATNATDAATNTVKATYTAFDTPTNKAANAAEGNHLEPDANNTYPHTVTTINPADILPVIPKQDSKVETQAENNDEGKVENIRETTVESDTRGFLIPGEVFNAALAEGKFTDENDAKIRLLPLSRRERDSIINQLLGRPHQRIPAADYDGGHVQGPVPFVDPNSRGFRAYPVHVQEKILKLIKDEALVRMVARKMLYKLSGEDLTLLKGKRLAFMIFPTVCSVLPELKQSFIQRCLHLSSRMKQYYETHPLKEKYERVLPILINVFNASNQTYDKRRLCQALRKKHGIFLEVGTVQNLMDRLGLIPKRRRPHH